MLDRILVAVFGLALIATPACSDDSGSNTGSDGTVTGDGTTKTADGGKTTADAGAGADGGGSADGGGKITAKDYEGTWTGKWNNTTFNSTGNAKMTVKVDTTKKTVEFKMDIDGNAFGRSDPPAETFTGTYTSTEFKVGGTSSLFGPLTLTFKYSGTISGQGKPSGFDKVTFSGTNTTKKIDLKYQVYQSGSKFAEGTFVLDKQ